MPRAELTELETKLLHALQIMTVQQELRYRKGLEDLRYQCGLEDLTTQEKHQQKEK